MANEIDGDLPPADESYEEWLAGYDRRQWIDDLQSVAVDVVIWSADAQGIKTLLVRRTEQPERGRWVLPGGFVRKSDRLEPTARRVLEAKALLTERLPLEPLCFFDDPRRDERTHTLSMGYVLRCPDGLLPPVDGRLRRAAYLDGHKLRGADGEHISLGFDHDEIVAVAVDHARRAIQADVLWPAPLVMHDGRFTVADLQEVREQFGQTITTDALRRLVSSNQRVERAGWVDRDPRSPTNHKTVTAYPRALLCACRAASVKDDLGVEWTTSRVGSAAALAQQEDGTEAAEDDECREQRREQVVSQA